MNLMNEICFEKNCLKESISQVGGYTLCFRDYCPISTMQLGIHLPLSECHYNALLAAFPYMHSEFAIQ